VSRAAVGAPRIETGSSCEGVEGRLAALARAGGPLRRVLAALAARLVARRAFEPLGYARLRDYAGERLGVSARLLQELAAVDARLVELPQLEAALIRGQLPWSKVRLVARTASPGDEARWIARARRTSVRVLERELRSVARGALGRAKLGPGDEEGGSREPAEAVTLHVPPRVAFQWHRTCREAERVAGETTSRAAVLEWLTAEVLAGLPAGIVEVEGDRRGELEPAGRSRPEPEARPDAGLDAESDAEAEASAARDTAADLEGAATTGLEPGGGPAGLPGFVCTLVEGLETLDPFELDARLRRTIRLEQRREAELAPLLRAVSAPGFAWRGAFRSLSSFARERLGMSPRKARALLRIERVGDVCPELRAAFRDGELSWAQAQQVARLLVGGEADHAHLARWVAWAATVSVRRLEQTVAAAVALGAQECDSETIAAAEEHALRDDAQAAQATAGRQTCAHPTLSGDGPPWMGSVRVHVVAPREVVRLFTATLCSVRLELERETGRLPTAAQGFEVMLDRATAGWAVRDPLLRRRSRRELAIFERDGWRCTVPGCTSRRNLQRHHIEFRSQGGSDAAENQTTLCAFHHLRGVHGGRIRIRGRAPVALRFDLGIRADRAPLVSYASGDRLVG
jgi:hypothetical protein